MTQAVGRTGGQMGVAAGGSQGLTTALLLRDAAGLLATAGLPEPRREALILLGAVAGRSPAGLWLDREQPIAPEVRAAFREAVTRRAAGVPAAYAVGSAAFRTLELAVDARVLIPRPETEGLVEHVLTWCRQHGRWGVAADIGTGSGCIALSLAVEGAFEFVHATDLSAPALHLARRNASAVAPAVPLEFRLGDLLWPLGADRVDVVVSNPPYVSAGEWEALEPGVRDHEPRVALVGGPDGLAHVRALLRLAPARLREGGLLALELDCRRAAQVLSLAREGGWSARVEPDLFGRERYLLATREDA